MTPGEEDAYANLPPAIAEALERAETRHREAVKTHNPYEDLPLLSCARVAGTEFQVYELTRPIAGMKETNAPVVLHAGNARFRVFCQFVTDQWFSDFGSFMRAFLAKEKLLVKEKKLRLGLPDHADDHDPPPSTAGAAGNLQLETDPDSDLLQYGLQITDDVYLVGFSGPETSTVTSRPLVLGILILAAKAFEALADRLRLEFDPTQIREALEKLV